MKPTIKAWLGLTALAAVPFFAGCGGGSSLTAPTDPQPRSVSAALPDGLTVTPAEDRSIVSVGGMVTYTVTLANVTGSPIVYRPVIGGAAPSGNVPAALVVKDAGGKTAFPVGNIPLFVFIGPSTTLAPGQSVSGTLAFGGSD